MKVIVKVLAVLLVLTLSIGLTGCVGTGGSQTEDQTKTAEATTTEAAKTADTAPAKEVTVNFPCIWVGKDSKASVVAEIIKQFNDENTGKIKVAVEEIGDYQAYRDKMRTNIAAGAAPDVFTFDNVVSESPIFFKSGKLMDLTPYMESGWKASFLEDSIKTVTYENKIMAVPYEFGVTPVLYNSRLLEQAGIKEFPKTYTDFIAMCDTLKEKGITPMSQMTGENAWTSMLWYSQLVVALGGPDVYKNGFDDPAFLEAAKMMKKLYEYTTKDAVGATAAIAGGHFLNERTAMLMNGGWYIGRIKKEGINNLYDYVNAAPMPTIENGKGKEGGYIGFLQACIAAGAQKDKDKEAAVIKFLQAMTAPDNVKKLSMSSGSMFVVKFDVKPEDKLDRIQSQMIDQTNKAPYVVPHFQSMVKPAVASEFPMALSSMILGTTTPEQFVEKLKKLSES